MAWGTVRPQRWLRGVPVEALQNKFRLFFRIMRLKIMGFLEV